jgi:hypothetical protein
MATLQVVRLKRRWGTVVPDRQPNEAEFQALHVALKGIDALLAGREPDQEFVENFLQAPQVQEAMLRFAPVVGKVQ